MRIWGESKRDSSGLQNKVNTQNLHRNVLTDPRTSNLDFLRFDLESYSFYSTYVLGFLIKFLPYQVNKSNTKGGRGLPKHIKGSSFWIHITRSYQDQIFYKGFTTGKVLSSFKNMNYHKGTQENHHPNEQLSEESDRFASSHLLVTLFIFIYKAIRDMAADLLSMNTGLQNLLHLKKTSLSRSALQHSHLVVPYRKKPNTCVSNLCSSENIKDVNINPEHEDTNIINDVISGEISCAITYSSEKTKIIIQRHG